VSVLLLGHPVRAGLARGTLTFEPVPTAGGILVRPEIDPFLGDLGNGFGALVGGTLPTPGGAPLPPGPPAVAGTDIGLLLPGDAAVVDGSAGTVRLDEVTRVEVVTAFLQREDGRILLLRRSERVGSFRGAWAAVSGFLEAASPELQAIQEIEEETGIPRTQLTLVRTGPPVRARGGDRLYLVHPFRFRVPTVDVHIDWEHSEMEWVLPEEITRRPTVPRLERAWEAVEAAGVPPSGPAPGKR